MGMDDPGPMPAERKPPEYTFEEERTQADARRHQAREHLDTAEAAILSWSRALEEDSENAPSVTHILFSVLTNISRAAGLLEDE